MSHPGHTRAFDWDEAARLYWQGGWTLQMIADRLGVSVSAVHRVVVPGEAARRDEALRVWRQQNRAVCPGCGGPMSRRSGNRNALTKLCQSCDARSKVTTVRSDTLLCSQCKLWKPDSEFSVDRGRKARRFRTHSCKKCRNAYMAHWRKSHGR